MAGFDDVSKKAQNFLKDGKAQVQAALQSEKGEEISDSVLGSVAGAADKLTGGKYHDKIEAAKAQADKKLGHE